MTLPRDSEGPRSYRHVSSSTVAAITYERSTRTRCWVYVSAGTLDSLSGRDLYS